MSTIAFTPTGAKPTVRSLYGLVVRILVGYTAWYGKTYDEWCQEKAWRIYEYLRWCFYHREPIDLQHLAFTVYRERLIHVSKLLWKPHKNRFLDFKPSPFIRNFLRYLIEQLKELGYIKEEYVDLIRVEKKVVSTPSHDELVDICTWKPDP